MAIVGEPCNVDTRANILALFMTLLCPRLCVDMYYTNTLVVTVQLSFLSDRSEHCTHPGDTTHHTHTLHITQTKIIVELGFPDYKYITK